METELDNIGMGGRLRRKAFQSKDKEKDLVVYQTAGCCSYAVLDEYGKANSSSTASATISIDDLQPWKRAAVACNCSTTSTSGSSSMAAQAVLVDWTCLPDDTILQVFSRLNYRDRANLASSCRAWRNIGSFPCLWQALDLRAHCCDTTTTLSLASRCSANLRSLRFRGSEAAAAVMNLQARGLREVSGDFCRDITDATLAIMAARHGLMESLQLGPCEKISSDAIRAVALCCPRLKCLRLSGVCEVKAVDLIALGRHCKCLEEIALLDCGGIIASALACVVSLRFISVAGIRTINWSAASIAWSKHLHNLIGLDVSRTDVSPTAISRFLESSKSLKVLCALNCSSLEEDPCNPSLFISSKGKLLLTLFTDIFQGIASLCYSKANAAVDASTEEKKDVFKIWRAWNHNNGSPKNMEEVVNWLEWILSHTLLRIAETNPQRMDEFWLRKGTALLLSLVQSSQEDVQERAATGLATFVVIDDENATVDAARAETVMTYGGIPLLLDLARSFREGIQLAAVKAIANLSVNTKVAKTVADEGGISILSDLARSMNRLVAEEAAGGLWNLSVGEEHKGAIAEAGGIKALVDLIFKWPSGIDRVLERAAGALANLAADDKCCMEVAMAGGVHALVMLARTCKAEGVQEQVWDISKKQLTDVHIYQEEITSFMVIQQSFYIYVGNCSGNVSVLNIDMDTYRLVHMPYNIPYTISHGQSNEANDNAVMYILPQPMSDNRRVLIIFRDGLINLWGIQKSETLFTCGRNMPLVMHNEAKKVVSACWTCSFGSKIAVGYSNGEILIWGVPKASDKIPSAVREKELSLKNIPLLKLNLGYKMEKVPILSLRWISADGQASRLYVNGASEHGSSNIFQVIILNENAESRTIKLVLPLSEACVDMQIVSTIAENNKCKKNALLLLLRSGCLCAYDDSEIEHYLLQCHSKFPPPLPRQISVKLPFGDSNVTVAQYITDVPNLSSNMAEDHKLSTKKFSSFLPPDLEEPDRNCFSTHFCGFSKTSNLYMTGHYDGAINFWDASWPLLSPIFSIKQKSEDDHPLRDTPVTSLYFDVSSEILVCGYQNGLVSIFQFKGTQSAADNIFSLLQARQGCNYIVHNIKLNGAIVAISMQPSSGHIAIGTDRGYVSVIEMEGMSVLYERHFPCEHSGIISLEFECSLNKSNKNILLAALNDSSVFAFEFDKGSAESTPVVHPKRTSRALFMQILNELNMSPRGLQKHDFLGESKGNSMKSNVLRQSLLLLCSEKSIRIYSLGHIIQGIKKVCHKKKLHGTCCWASTFHSPDDIGLILIFTCGKIEIRSLPDLMLLRETSVRGFTFPDINSGSGFSGSLCASCDGDIIAVMGDQEMFFLSLFQKGNYRLLASVHEVYKKDMVASLEKLSSKMTHTHKEKKSGIFNTVIREMKGKKTDEATEFLDSDAVIGQELSAIFSTINFSLNVENFKSHSIGEDDVELNIDDINLEDPIEKTKGHEIAVNDKRKLGKKFQSLKGKLKSITRKAETSINEEHGGGKVIGAVDEIKKKYGFPSSGELNAPKLAQSKLSENLAKLQGINMRTAEMQDNARSFSSMANELLRTAEQAKRMP